MQTIHDIMTKNVDTLDPSADLIEIAQAMKKQDVGILPVSDGRRVQGIVTKSDVVLRALARNKDPRNTRASDVMTRDIDYIYEDQTVEEAAELMRRDHVQHLLVLDRQKGLLGIVSLDDLAGTSSSRSWMNRLFGESPSQSLVSSRPQVSGLSVNNGAALGIISVAVLTLGFFAWRRRLGVSDIVPESLAKVGREIRAA